MIQFVHDVLKFVIHVGPWVVAWAIGAGFTGRFIYMKWMEDEDPSNKKVADAGWTVSVLGGAAWPFSLVIIMILWLITLGVSIADRVFSQRGPSDINPADQDK